MPETKRESLGQWPKVTCSAGSAIGESGGAQETCMQKIFWTALVVVALITSSGFAKGKPSGDKGHNAKQNHAHDRDDHKGHDRNEHSGNKGPSSRPAGWDKGKKTGWGNCDVPPGQAKPAGCGSHVSHHDRDHHVAHHERTARTNPTPRPYPVTRTTRTTTRTRTTTTASTTAPKGEHPFSPTLRKKKEVESQERLNSGEKTK